MNVMTMMMMMMTMMMMMMMMAGEYTELDAGADSAHAGPILSLVAEEDGTRLLSCSADGTVKVRGMMTMMMMMMMMMMMVVMMMMMVPLP
jgi:hypothetical protein